MPEPTPPIPPDIPGQPTIQVWAYGGYPPHTFVYIWDGNGGRGAWGFAPRSPGSLSGPGAVSSNTGHKGYPVGPRVPITQEQLHNANEYVARSIQHPPYYDIPAGAQCSNWAANVLHAAGLTPASFDLPTDAVQLPDPYDPFDPVSAIFNDVLDFLRNVNNPWSQRIATIGKDVLDQVAFSVSSFFQANFQFLYSALQNLPGYRDPLVLDLDGDGVETVDAAQPGSVLFDLGGTGVKARFGWVNGDDGLLVRDLNGNGVIDDGTELFSDATPLRSGAKAADGLAALADLDTDSNGRVDARDPAWGQLRVWRDLNGDGRSQSNELFTLDQAGVASFSTARRTNTQQLTNGNTIGDVSTFTRTDGTTSATADVNFAVDTTVREFTSSVVVLPEVNDLPEMDGSGLVRDLHEAASQSSDLRTLLSDFAHATDRTTQLALVDRLLQAWADTSGLADSTDARDPTQYVVRYERMGVVRREDHVVDGGYAQLYSSSSTSVGGYELGSAYDAAGQPIRDDQNAYLDADFRALVARTNQKVHALEAFAGRYLFTSPGQQLLDVAAPNGTELFGGNSSLPNVFQVNFSSQQMDTVDAAYSALRDAVYYGLALQTRLRPALDQVVATGPSGYEKLDFTRCEQYFRTAVAQDPARGLGDLVDLTRALGPTLINDGWRGPGLLEELLRAQTPTPELQAEYAALGVSFIGQPGSSRTGTGQSEVFVAGGTSDVITGGGGVDIVFAGGGDDRVTGGSDADLLDGGAGNDQLYGQGGNDVLYGRDGNDVLDGGEGHDRLDGGAGRDTLRGGGGDDRLDGGAGSDSLSGGNGNDTYVFGRGSGQDRIDNSDMAGADRRDTIAFTDGVAPEDVTIARDGIDGLVVSIAGTADTITVPDFFLGMDDTGRSNWSVDQITFADGTTWDRARILSESLTGTAGDDTRYGYASNDVMHGLAGNDTLSGRGGDDQLFGDEGNDSLMGDQGDDVLDGGTGDDQLAGGGGADLLLGGAGNDSLDGSDGDDRLDGGADDDTLAGGDGIDRLEGGTGDDGLDGGAGNDTYVFGRGAGHDRVFTAGNGPDNSDTLQLTEGVTPDQLRAARDGSNLVLSIADTSDTFTVEYFFSDETYRGISRVVFADGTVWDTGQILRETLNGTPGNDTLYGSDGADTIRGFAGDDQLFGEAGDDVLLGGDGNDGLSGGDSADRLEGGDGDDSLNGDAGNDVLLGGAGADQLGGGAGDDRLDGGPGTDYLDGGAGSDTYVFGRGSGQDDVFGWDGTPGKVDTLEFTPDVAPADVIIVRSGNDLQVSLADTADTFTVEYFFLDNDYRVDQFRFADGTTWNTDDILAIAEGRQPTPHASMATSVDANGPAADDLAPRDARDLAGIRHWAAGVGVPRPHGPAGVAALARDAVHSGRIPGERVPLTLTGGIVVATPPFHAHEDGGPEVSRIVTSVLGGHAVELSPSGHGPGEWLPGSEFPAAEAVPDRATAWVAPFGPRFEPIGVTVPELADGSPPQPGNDVVLPATSADPFEVLRHAFLNPQTFAGPPHAVPTATARNGRAAGAVINHGPRTSPGITAWGLGALESTPKRPGEDIPLASTVTQLFATPPDEARLGRQVDSLVDALASFAPMAGAETAYWSARYEPGGPLVTPNIV